MSDAMDDECLPDCVKGCPEVFDRFTFDRIFKELLREGCDHEEAKDTILYTCALSALVMQERIDNGYYLEINPDDGMAPDLVELTRDVALKIRKAKIRKALNNKN